MGGTAGIWKFDGEPVERQLLEHMAETIKHRGPDGIGYWTREAIGIVNFQDWTTPESVNETQPLVAENGELCLTLHGRVDNREDLLALLDLRSGVSELVTDAELILRAYQRWGEDCPQKILGEFAFVVWDGRRQQLFCARDTDGWKPFYYYRDSSKFVWASEFPPFFRADGVPKEPNERFVADYLTNWMPNEDETLYQGILRLPPAHTLVVTQDALRTTRYWGLNSIQDVRYKTDEDYTERFLEIFRTGVRSQLRTNGPLSASLSGGLDSSSVVCVAVPMLNEVQRQQFEVFSLSFPNTDFDETNYIRDVVEKWGLTANLIDPREHPIPDAHQLARNYQYLPNYPNGSMEDALYRLARAKGFRVMLTGHGGDDWFTGSRYRAADLILNLRLPSLLRYLQDENKHSTDSVLKVLRTTLVRYGVSPLLPQWIKQPVRRMLRRSVTVPEWLNAQLAAQAQFVERRNRSFATEMLARPYARSAIYQGSTSYRGSHSYEMEERYAATFNVELRNPFHFRPLVEFGLGIPEEQRRRHGVIKVVLRRAMQGILPETIRQRTTKAEFSAVLPPEMTALGGRDFFRNLEIEQRGWVKAEPLRALFEEMEGYWKKGNPAYIAIGWTLWMALGIGVWCRQCLAESEFTAK